MGLSLSIEVRDPTNELLDYSFQSLLVWRSALRQRDSQALPNGVPEKNIEVIGLK